MLWHENIPSTDITPSHFILEQSFHAHCDEAKTVSDESFEAILDSCMVYAGSPFPPKDCSPGLFTGDQPDRFKYLFRSPNAKSKSLAKHIPRTLGRR